MTTRKTKTTFEEIDSRFTRSISAVVEFIESLRFPVAITQSDTGYVPPKRKSEQTALYQNSDVFLDYGDGRVSRGLRGLELLSRLCKGVPAENLFLFSNVIYYSTPSIVKKAGDEELTDIIIRNLGMTDIVANATSAAPNLVARFREACFRIGYQVRSGMFQKVNVESQMLVYAKKLTVAAAGNGTNVRGALDINFLEPTPTPSVSITPSPSPVPVSPTPTLSVTPTVSLSPTVTPTATATPTPTVTPTVTRTVTPTVSVTPSVSGTPLLSATPMPTPAVTDTPVVSITPTVTATITPTPSTTVTPTATAVPFITPTSSVSSTPNTTPGLTVTPTLTPTPTPTPTPSGS